MDNIHMLIRVNKRNKNVLENQVYSLTYFPFLEFLEILYSPRPLAKFVQWILQLKFNLAFVPPICSFVLMEEIV